MGSITIHELDAVLDRRLTEAAKQSRISKNRFIKDTLSRALGLPAAGCYADDYREFCGLWNAAERDAFDAFQTENARIDAGDWPS